MHSTNLVLLHVFLLLACLLHTRSFLVTKPTQRSLHSHLHQTRKSGDATIAENKYANSAYEWDESLEAGIQLCGSEVKSCRMKGQVNLQDGNIDIRSGEVWMTGVHISEYAKTGPYYQHEPKRFRKILLHKKEILKLEQRQIQKNLELIPKRIYWSEKNFVKVEIGVGKKKSTQDKRDDIIKKDGDRQVRRIMKGGYD